MKPKNLLLLCVTAFMIYVAHGMDTHTNLGPMSFWQSITRTHKASAKLEAYEARPETVAQARAYLTALNHPNPASVGVKMCNEEYVHGAHALYSPQTNTVFLKKENLRSEIVIDDRRAIDINAIVNKLTLAHECAHAVHDSNGHNTDRSFIRNYRASIIAGFALGGGWGVYNNSFTTVASMAALQAFALSIETPIFNKFVQQPRELRAEVEGLRALITTGETNEALISWRMWEPMRKNPKTGKFYVEKLESFWKNWGTHPTSAARYWAAKPLIKEHYPELELK